MLLLPAAARLWKLREALIAAERGIHEFSGNLRILTGAVCRGGLVQAGEFSAIGDTMMRREPSKK
jgi:hypothetical protein